MSPTIDPRDAQRALAEAIARYAPMLHVPQEISAVGILRTIAEKETTSADRYAACLHERAYCYGGRYHTPALAHEEWLYGCAVHCSWGPWQIMFANAVMRGFTGDPVALRDPMVSGLFVVHHLNARVFYRFVDETPADVFDAWNSGTARDHIDPVEYKREAAIIYRRIMDGGLRT